MNDLNNTHRYDGLDSDAIASIESLARNNPGMQTDVHRLARGDSPEQVTQKLLRRIEALEKRSVADAQRLPCPTCRTCPTCGRAPQPTPYIMPQTLPPAAIWPTNVPRPVNIPLTFGDSTPGVYGDINTTYRPNLTTWSSSGQSGLMDCSAPALPNGCPDFRDPAER